MRPLVKNYFNSTEINSLRYKLHYVEYLLIVTQYSGHYVFLCKRV